MPAGPTRDSHHIERRSQRVRRNPARFVAEGSGQTFATAGTATAGVAGAFFVRRAFRLLPAGARAVPWRLFSCDGYVVERADGALNVA